MVWWYSTISLYLRAPYLSQDPNVVQWNYFFKIFLKFKILKKCFFFTDHKEWIYDNWMKLASLKGVKSWPKCLFCINMIHRWTYKEYLHHKKYHLDVNLPDMSSKLNSFQTTCFFPHLSDKTIFLISISQFGKMKRNKKCMLS